MSKKRNVMEITPPMFLENYPDEQEVYHGMKCTACSGNGWGWDHEVTNERVKKTCSFCKGSGKVKAVITISWQPDGEIIGKTGKYE